MGDDPLRWLCETSAGRVVSPAQLLPYVDDAVMEILLFDGPTTVISKSHRRTFPGALRRAIEVRDRRCQHPCGCDVGVDRCDVDHIVPWSESRRTDQGNGRLLCRGHNRHRDLRDSDAQPLPEREVDRDDELAARRRWRADHDVPDRPEPDWVVHRTHVDDLDAATFDLRFGDTG